jgi:hypothetical protein
MSQAPSSLSKVSTAPAFQYQSESLSRGCFRFVRLLPKLKDGTLRLELRSNVPVGAKDFSYRALSYEWGPSEPRRTIMINDQILVIRENLFLALESLYDHHAGVNDFGWFWVDAICIDQNSVVDRESQVQQMNEVYREASEVVAWLGPSRHSCDCDVFMILEQLGSDRGACVKRFGPSGSDDISKTKGRFEALTSLCKRAYWRRMWIVQEVILARNVRVLCGQHSTDLLNVLKSVDLWYLSPDFRLEDTDFRPFNKLALFFRDHGSIRSTGMPLLRLTLYFGEQLCTLPHDKVYGLLGLTNNTKAINVDYGVSLQTLFFKILESSNLDTTWEEWYGLADVLDVNVEITAISLRFLSKDIQTPPTVWTMSLPVLASTKFLELRREASNCETQRRLLFNRFMKWYGVEYPMETNFNWFKIVLDRYRAACLGGSNQLCSICRCPICMQSWPAVLQSEQLQGSPDLDYSAYRWLEDKDGSLMDQIEIPHVFLVFKHGNYMATIVDYINDGTVHGLLFRDPYYYSWKTEHFHKAGSTIRRIYIKLPFISALMLLAHIYQRDPVTEL